MIALGSLTGMAEIMRAVANLQAAPSAVARAGALLLWEEWRAHGGALQCATIAHFLADSADSVEDELEWDLRSLDAAMGPRGSGDDCALLAQFMPSIHLNVGDCYRRLRQFASARQHAEAGLSGLAALADGEYRDAVAQGLAKLRTRLPADR